MTKREKDKIESTIQCFQNALEKYDLDEIFRKDLEIRIECLNWVLENIG